MKFVKVKKIVPDVRQDIYHLTVEKNHNFFGNGICLHNCSYRGIVGVIVINHGEKRFEIKRGERIAQMVFAKIEVPEVEIKNELSETWRGEGGFGHTGVK